eukprot:10957531-Alexandrium_andersonii.AAC.1
MEDIAALDDAPTPLAVTFWRPSSETVTRHRNPLLQEGRASLHNCLQLDWLHAASLGIFQDYLAHLLRGLFVANVWQVPGGSEARVSLSVGRLEQELFE